MVLIQLLKEHFLENTTIFRKSGILFYFRFFPLFLFPTLSISQAIPLERVSSELGLSQNLVNCLLQDSKGFLWVGTNDGLNRFDGYGFKVFRNDPFDSLSISDNRILYIIEDGRGIFWIGTLAGLNVFDPEKEAFYKSPFSKLIGNKPISAMLEGWDGSIWVLVDGQNLFRITTGEKGTFQITQLKIESQNGDKPIMLRTIGQVGENRFWVTSSDYDTVWEFDYDPNSQKTIWRDTFPYLSQDLQSLFTDKTVGKRLGLGPGNDVWFGIEKILVKFDGDSHQFSYYDFGEKGIFPPFGFGATVGLTGLNDSIVLCAAYRQYVFFDVKNYRISRSVSEENPLLAGSTTCGIKDQGGIIWMGTLGTGLLKSDNKSKRFAEKSTNSSLLLSKGQSIRSIFEISSGQVFYSMVSGDDNQVVFVSEGNSTTAVPGISRTIYSFFEDSEKRIWAGGEGLYKLSKNQNGNWEAEKPVFIHPDDSNSSTLEGGINNKICDIIAAKDDGLWVSTPTEICHFDKKTGVFTCSSFHAPLSFFSHDYASLYQDNDDFIWIGSPYGLLKFDPKNKSFESFTTDVNNPRSLSQNVINCIEPDYKAPERYLWVATAGGGLNLFDKQTKTFEHFTEKDGLPNMTVYATLFDETGNLWMSTNSGISVYNPTDKSFLNFDVKDGLQDNEFNGRAYWKGKSGKIYFGGINGVNIFRPSEILKANSHVPQIVLTDFKLSNRSVSVRDKGAPLKRNIAYSKEIVLSYDQKSFTFEFAALDFTEPSKNKYAIKMEGFDPDWQQIGTNRSATYTNLDPGTYTFRVKGSNNDGVWNEEGTSVKVIILPPWWRTWWAYLIYLSVIGSLAFYLWKREIREKELQHQLELEHVAAENLKEVDQLKSRFFANISHEFRTPLTLILGQLDSSMGRIKDESVKSKLGMAFRNGKRLLQLINQLLDLSKLEAGSMHLYTAKKDIVPFLKNLYFSFESLAEQRNLSMAFQCDEASLPMFFDEEKLEKVFFNLLSNAIKFTPEGGKIAMMVKKASPPFLIEITVRDTGIGIPAERLAHVFDRFFQVDSSRTREREGTGIGLALVKEFVELHGGKVLVKSQEGFGTDFIVYLPFGESLNEGDSELRKSQDFDSHYSEANLKEIVPTPSQRKTQSAKTAVAQLLVVEDNNDVRSYLCDHLNEAGYHVTEAVNGVEGLRKAQEQTPDLILTDVMMPSMDGYEFSRHIRSDERTSHIPIIMLTAKAAEEDKLEGLETGVDDYLTKPFSTKELLARVSNLIKIRQQLRERFSQATIIRPAEVSVISTDQIFLQKVIQSIEEHMGDEQFGLEPLSAAVNMSPTNLNRKLNALIGQPAGNLIRSMRLQRAVDLLVKQAGNVTEIAFEVGFAIPENFSRSFKKQFGCSPLEYQKKMLESQK